jgi:hypothetical protein
MKRCQVYSVVIAVAAVIIAIGSMINSLGNSAGVRAISPDQQNYLVTDDNNKILYVNRSEPIRVSLIGPHTLRDKDYTWVNHDRDIIEISGTGPKVMVMGKRPGKARLTVEHENAKFILDISLLVIPENPKVNAYITVPDNRMTVPSGGRKVIKAVLHNADPSEAEHISWFNKSPSILDVSADGRIAHVTGKNQGHGIIILEHELAAFQVTVDVFVEN